MTEKIVGKKDSISENSIENNAVDLDIKVNAEKTGQGSAVSIGDGVFLTAAHNFINFKTGQQISSLRATLREGHSTEGDSDSIGKSDMYNIGEYGAGFSGTDRTDFGVLTTDMKDTPTASMIIFENPNDATGKIKSAGYPSSSKELTHKLDGKKT